MVLNPDICEVTFFSTNCHEAKWQPTISAKNTRLLYNPQPKFLGVTLDRLLSICQMPSTRLPHLEGVELEKGRADGSYKALQLSLLCGSNAATLGRPFPY